MEERRILVLGSDLAAASAVKSLCEAGHTEVLVIDSGREPGGALGAQTGLGFRYEKLPLLVGEEEAAAFEALGAPLSCRSFRIRVVRAGDHLAKALCWSRGERPWWYPPSGRACYPRGGWGRLLRSIFSGPCAEYTFYTPRRIDLGRRVAVLRNGRILRFGAIISSYPLPLLLEAIAPWDLPKEARELAGSLGWAGVINTALGVRGEPPQEDLALHGTRASRNHSFYVLTNIDPPSTPPGHYLIECLMSYCRKHPPPPDQVGRSVAEARWAKILGNKGQIVSERIYIHAHITPLEAPKDLLERVRAELEARGVVLTGYAGLWKNLTPAQQVEHGHEIRI